jgi:hypothetical protein
MKSKTEDQIVAVVCMTALGMGAGLFMYTFFQVLHFAAKMAGA